jgi:hypothetical protein
MTWYTWLEQGRDIRVSRDTLERIATALRLTQTDVDYLFSLSGVARTDTRNGDGTFELDNGIMRALDAFHSLATDPAHRGRHHPGRRGRAWS